MLRRCSPSHVEDGLESAEFRHLLRALHRHARFSRADKTSVGPQKHWKAPRAPGVRAPLQEPIVPALEETLAGICTMISGSRQVRSVWRASVIRGMPPVLIRTDHRT
jgi:hypothetical protein